jgi:hypothetical protein
MKDIDQLLFLAKNPYYKLMPDEQRILDAFLAKQRAKRLRQSQEQNSNESSQNTRVTVRNIVDKVDTYLPEVHS